MKIKLRKHDRVIALAGVGIFCIGLLAWNNEPTYRDTDTVYYRDTIPDKIGNRENTTDPERSNSKDIERDIRRDLDRELQKLDEAERTLENLSQKNWNELNEHIEREIGGIDLDKIAAEVSDALAKVDMKKINEEVMAALKDVDMEKIRQSVSESLADANIKIDSDEMRGAMAEAREEIQRATAEAKKEMNVQLAEVKKINKDEIQKAISEAKTELKKVKEDLKNEKWEFKKEFEDARRDIRKAREEIKGYQKMIYEMDDDKLVNTAEDYIIEYKDDTLLINGKAQPDDITSKYKKYFNKSNTTIRKEKGEIDIVN